MEKKDIEKLAELARIELSDSEKDNLLKDIEGILKFVDQVQKVKTDDAAGGRVGTPHNVMREDGEPHESGARSGALLGSAPKTHNNFIRVKKIL